MSAVILNGKTLKNEILLSLKEKVAFLNPKPGLAVIQVGEDPASTTYVRNKEKACFEVGVNFQKINLPGTTTATEVLAAIDRLNADPTVHGLLVQFPLPDSLMGMKQQIIERIKPAKDVDGLNPLSSFTPATPKGIMRLLEHYRLKPAGRHAVIVGRSIMVGKPVSSLLLSEDATVTITHSKTQNLPILLRQADIMIAALGQPNFIHSEWIKPGAIVIDVGINRTPTGIVGDVDFTGAKEVAGYISPVPGGVGPMTIAMLMENILEAYRLQP